MKNNVIEEKNKIIDEKNCAIETMKQTNISLLDKIKNMEEQMQKQDKENSENLM